MKIRSGNYIFEFKSAAVRYRNSKNEEVILTGKRHHEIFLKIPVEDLELSKKNREDGFIIWSKRKDESDQEAKEEFYTRYQATNIAERCNIVFVGPELTSEALW